MDAWDFCTDLVVNLKMFNVKELILKYHLSPIIDVYTKFMKFIWEYNNYNRTAMHLEKCNVYQVRISRGI